jgi:hypothetical protein
MGPGLWMDGSGRNKLDGTQLFSPAPHLFFWLSRRARTLPVRFPSIAGGVNDNNINGLVYVLRCMVASALSHPIGACLCVAGTGKPHLTHMMHRSSHTPFSRTSRTTVMGYHSHHYEYAFYVIHLLVSLR